ncbi:DNA primase DnaG [Candidatus Syntrophocurvum alkaliphilum]|uniref:DNA primase n=1 Tax=Candidatus Syntrophocurvum alkaliphilum TaxID=2293317 RepID=A0A6I6DCL1_9FIRM|nr:DNA primase [Candidatus Syntrophocurvum alkaliphilum]QGT99969.1 DNA primase DnaG [Candidatus Syntrophocurvum alkaliphilum]
MTKYFDDQLIRDILFRIDIVEIIGETVQLNRKGNRYWGLCPFHQEKTPSFSVTPEKEMFYCFGCRTGGDVFSFVMKRDGASFKEAVELLADKAGIELRSLKNENNEVKQVLEVNKNAADYYNKNLFTPASTKALKYLKKRKVSDESLKRYIIGYALDEWDGLKNYLLKHGFSKKIIEKSGLISLNKKGTNHYDLFRNRIIFPIQNFRGDIIGFGGRVLDDSLPKYINSPETDLFSKRKNLYGLYQAKDSIRKRNEVVLVEGYMDCIKLGQADITNVVASLGTAFTVDQAKLLQKYTEKVIILYDGDEAGQREAIKAINSLLKANLKTDVVALPPGKDPDEYIALNGKEEFLRYIKNNSYNYIEFKINSNINSTEELNLENKNKIINEVKKDINGLNSEIEKDYFIRLLSEKLKLEENTVYREIKSKKSSNLPHKRNKIQISRDNKRYGNYSIQEKIMAKMLKDEEFFNYIVDTIGIDFIHNQQYKALLKIYQGLQGSHKDKINQLFTIAVEQDLNSEFARITFIGDEELNKIEIMDYVKRVKIMKQDAKWQKLFAKIRQLSDEGDFYSVLDFILKIDKLLNKAQKGGTK